MEEKTLQDLGFSSIHELIELTYQIDLKEPINKIWFDEWKLKDGTKEGLLKLIDIQA